jgi:hypothetical protein
MQKRLSVGAIMSSTHEHTAVMSAMNAVITGHPLRKISLGLPIAVALRSKGCTA